MEHLRAGGQLENADGASNLWKLLDVTPTAGNVLHHAKIVKGKAVDREMLRAAQEIQDHLYEGRGSESEGVTSSVALLNKATQAWSPANSDGSRPAWEDFPERCRFLDDAIPGLPTSFSALDRKIMGLQGLVLLGGPPKMGKSVMALNIALHVARDVEGASVLYYDVENGWNIVVLRLLSNLYGRTISQLRERGKSEVEAWQADLEEKVPGLYLTTDNSLMRPDAIHRQIQRAGADKTLLVLDSLQKLPPLEKQRRDSIDRWLRELEQIKQDPNIAILLISELSRGEKEAHYKNPTLGAFKESGDIEYTADVALQFTKAKAPGQAALHCVANRHGESGYVADYSYEQFKHWRWTEVPNRGDV
jgi:replicative DNA helicase